MSHGRTMIILIQIRGRTPGEPAAGRRAHRLLP